jgi:hypothetical protein
MTNDISTAGRQRLLFDISIFLCRQVSMTKINIDEHRNMIDKSITIKKRSSVVVSSTVDHCF